MEGGRKSSDKTLNGSKLLNMFKNNGGKKEGLTPSPTSQNCS